MKVIMTGFAVDMKKTMRLLMLSALMALSLSTNAKSPNGIYLTASDFCSRKLSYERSRIRLNHSVLELPYLMIIDNGKKIKLSKKDVYGFAVDDDMAYRFGGNQEYEVVEEGSITIYTRTEHVFQGKGFKARKNYYFSTSPGTEMMPLTVDNLKNAYRTDDRFLDLIDQFFVNGDVTGYDNIHHTYKVNYVYSKTLQQ